MPSYWHWWMSLWAAYISSQKRPRGSSERREVRPVVASARSGAHGLAGMRIWTLLSCPPSSALLCWHSRYLTIFVVNGHATLPNACHNSRHLCKLAWIVCAAQSSCSRNFISIIMVQNALPIILSTSFGGRLPVTWRIPSDGGHISIPLA
jgi:hypothetical protein